DRPTKDMQRGMSAHHTVAEVPINCPGNLRSHRWWGAIQRVPDNIVALVKGNDIGQNLLVIPADETLVGHLPTPARIEHGGVKGNLVTLGRYNPRAAFISIAVLMIEQFCLHKCLLPCKRIIS